MVLCKPLYLLTVSRDLGEVQVAEATAGVGRSPACAAAQNLLQKTKLGVEIAGIADKSESWMYCSSHLPNRYLCGLVVSK